MEKILEICEWCSDTFGTTLLILLILALLPLILAVGMLLFVLAVPIGIAYDIIKSFRNPNK
jgi:hypothetical protein